MKIIEKSNEVLFVITTKDELESETSMSGLYWYVIDQTVFDLVRSYVDFHKDRLNILIQSKDEKGNILYWEEGYHKKLVDMISFQCDDSMRKNVSNSLCALGY